MTLSLSQFDHVGGQIVELGITVRVTVRPQDYRELADQPYDSVASIEMGEHVGEDQYPVYVTTLHRLLRPGGRLLLRQMSRGANAPGGGAFIESYITPDMHIRPSGSTIGLLERAGLEVRDVESLRKHYVTTVDAWARTLETDRARATRLIGPQSCRVWRLYLAGDGLAFAENQMGVDQILAVRPTPAGDGLMPADRRDQLVPSLERGFAA
ncbi:class I SAM-dependent methyltransferase [Actinoalloteichus fjordicus]|uniref:class I SAM-dependent methyltransferase n=1 Tax=Actinoalloteichus TaxID=65496 RepID=UPI00384C8202